MMRKTTLIFLIASAIVMIMGVTAATAATLDLNVHGSYTNDTAACGTCHSTHAAQGASLVQNIISNAAQNTVYNTCVYCHKDTAQSRYDVENGKIIGFGDDYTASGGGFKANYDEAGSATLGAPSSMHNVIASDTNTSVPGWDTALGTAKTMDLTCSSCHDPHASDSGASRALRTTILGEAVGTDPALSITSSILDYANKNNAGYGDEVITYGAGWNAFCGACHKDFNQGTGAGHDVTLGAFTNMARHAVGIDPINDYSGTTHSVGAGTYTGVNAANLDTNGYDPGDDAAKLPLDSNGEITCMTCHYAHSTPETNTVTFTRAGGGTTSSSTLLRLDNRGVCQACHNK